MTSYAHLALYYQVPSQLIGIDPRIISAAALLFMGLVVIAFVIRVWLTHPVNRVFLVGPYVTEDELRLLLRNLPTATAVGLFAITAGTARLLYASHSAGSLEGPLPHLFGAFEAAFSLRAACCVMLAAWRLCRKG